MWQFSALKKQINSSSHFKRSQVRNCVISIIFAGTVIIYVITLMKLREIHNLLRQK